MRKIEIERLTPEQTIQLDALLAETQGKNPSLRSMAKRALLDYRLWVEGSQPDEIGFWVDERGGDYAGFYHGSFFSSTGGTRLNALAVSREYRGQGVGSQLLKGFLGQAAMRGATYASLIVEQDNSRAVNLYSRHGFEIEELLVTSRGQRYSKMKRALGELDSSIAQVA